MGKADCLNLTLWRGRRRYNDQIPYIFRTPPIVKSVPVSAPVVSDLVQCSQVHEGSDLILVPKSQSSVLSFCGNAGRALGRPSHTTETPVSLTCSRAAV